MTLCEVFEVSERQGRTFSVPKPHRRMYTDVAGVRSDIKEVSTGITQRLLNLEGHAVSRIQLTAVEDRIDSLEQTRSEVKGSVRTWGIIWGVATFVIPIAISVYFSIQS